MYILSNSTIKLNRHSLFQWGQTYILDVGHLSFSESRDSFILAKRLPVHDSGIA
jgi:hypothetical protein